MSRNEEGRPSLVNLLKSLEREKCIQKEMIELRKENYQFWEAIKRHRDKIVEEYGEFRRNHQRQIHDLKTMMEEIMRRQEENVREFINKEVIYVSNAADIEAIIFLERKGWKGTAIIHEEEFARELSKNNIPYILQDPYSDTPW